MAINREGGTGRVEAIWLKRAKGGPMDAVDSAVLDAGYGLRDNANRGGRRQVTIISAERWAELMAALGTHLDPRARRANLLVSGVDLQDSRGRLLRLGEALLGINGETRPCEQMEDAHPGLQALMRERWGGGAFADVLDGGSVRVGDSVRWHLPLLDGA
jgi:MOSC domain-containing protein YiiM